MSDRRVEIVARSHDRIAGRFADWREEIQGDPRAECLAELTSRLAEGARVLELGCGAGLTDADFLELELPAEFFDAVCSFDVFNHVPRERLAGLLEGIAGRLRPGGFALNTFGASDLPGWTGEWLGAETFFSGFEPAENRRLVQAAGLEIVRDEVVEFVEPEGPVRFHWILAQR